MKSTILLRVSFSVLEIATVWQRRQIATSENADMYLERVLKQSWKSAYTNTSGAFNKRIRIVETMQTRRGSVRHASTANVLPKVTRQGQCRVDLPVPVHTWQFARLRDQHIKRLLPFKEHFSSALRYTRHMINAVGSCHTELFMCNCCNIATPKNRLTYKHYLAFNSSGNQLVLHCRFTFKQLSAI